jgi:hypothetical protein
LKTHSLSGIKSTNKALIKVCELPAKNGRPVWCMCKPTLQLRLKLEQTHRGH